MIQPIKLFTQYQLAPTLIYLPRHSIFRFSENKTLKLLVINQKI